VSRRILVAALSLVLLVLSGCGGGGKGATPGGGGGGGGGGGDQEGGGEGAASRFSLITDEQRAAITFDSDIVYREVDGESVELDVCRVEEADGPQAAVLLVHGGAFNGGDKADPEWNEMCYWIANAGYVAININYRLAPKHEFPAALEDIQAAVEWARDEADAYGIDPDRIGTIGGSAGGTISELLGTSGEGSTTEGNRVASVVSLSGAADLTERALELGSPARIQIRNVLQFLGCSELTNCPAAEAASPITHVDASDPPFFLAHADGDRVPVQQTEVLAEALREVGAEPEILIRPGQAHASRLLIDVEVQEALLAYLARTLG